MDFATNQPQTTDASATNPVIEAFARQRTHGQKPQHATRTVGCLDARKPSSKEWKPRTSVGGFFSGHSHLHGAFRLGACGRDNGGCSWTANLKRGSRGNSDRIRGHGCDEGDSIDCCPQPRSLGAHRWMVAKSINPRLVCDDHLVPWPLKHRASHVQNSSIWHTHSKPTSSFDPNWNSYHDLKGFAPLVLRNALFIYPRVLLLLKNANRCLRLCEPACHHHGIDAIGDVLHTLAPRPARGVVERVGPSQTVYTPERFPAQHCVAPESDAAITCPHDAILAAIRPKLTKSLH
mmetsp:Transcript_7442/g.14485  ORF Transcript_7442/g.14485 Transcript_7442/m.14485 type:complete len:291 (-) Transcript_7442:694-1566(-)